MGGILIGGQGRRMGMTTPKHLIPFRGERLMDPALRAARSVCSRVVLVGQGPGPGDVERVPDDPRATGPLAGILGLMGAYPETGLLVLACDMPQMNPAALRWLLGHRGPGIEAVLPRTRDGQLHPLGAVYEACSYSTLEALARQSTAGPRELAKREGVLVPEVPEALEVAWANINDLNQLRHLLDSFR